MEKEFDDLIELVGYNKAVEVLNEYFVKCYGFELEVN